MKIYVCVKHVPDSAATITIVGPNRISTDITFLMNPYDEHAMTEAARIKAQTPQAEVIAVCVGPAAAENTLRSAMAMGADRSILVVADDLPDSILTAAALSAAISRDGQPAMILGGKESIDSGGMQTLFRLAHRMGLPAAVNVVSVRLEEGSAVVTCEKEAGASDVLRLRLPCVIGAGKGLNTPRYPTFPDIVKSRKKEVRRVDLAALALPRPAAGMHIVDLQLAVEKRVPKALTGSAAEIARRIVAILKEEARVS